MKGNLVSNAPEPTPDRQPYLITRLFELLLPQLHFHALEVTRAEHLSRLAF